MRQLQLMHLHGNHSNQLSRCSILQELMELGCLFSATFSTL